MLEESKYVFGSPSNVQHGPIEYGIDAHPSPFSGDGSLPPIGVQSIRQFGPEMAVQRHFDRIGHGIWFQKHSDWGPEVEYRLIYVDPVGARSSIEVDISGCVTRLIVGTDYQGIALVRLPATSTRHSTFEDALPNRSGLARTGRYRTSPRSTVSGNGDVVAGL